MSPRERARLALLTVATLVLAGCVSSNAAPAPRAVGGCPLPHGAVGIAAAGRANAPIVTGTPALVAAIDGAIGQQAHLVIYDTGGQPAQVAKGSLQLAARNGPARADEQKALKADIQAALQGVRSKAPEANPLQALALASAAVKSSGSTGTVVLADSGLQTIGALDYTKEGMLLADPQELAEAVEAAGLLPDLSGITVALTGVGDTAAPQRPFDNATRTRLQEQWRALMTRAGAACVYVDPMPNGQTAPTGVPDVAEVTPPPAPEYDLDTPIPLRGDVLAFQDNSPQLMDPEAARAALAPLVTALQGTPGSITLTGTTASGGREEGRLQLSAQRAETAKQLLVAMGLDAQRITTTAVGTNFPGFREDTDDNGRQIPEVAALNRSVIVEVQP